MTDFKLIHDLRDLPETALCLDVSEGNRACVRSTLYRYTDILPMPDALAALSQHLEAYGHIYDHAVVHLNEGVQWDDRDGRLV